MRVFLILETRISFFFVSFPRFFLDVKHTIFFIFFNYLATVRYSIELKPG